MFVSEETTTQKIEMVTKDNNELTLDYQHWTPQQGDYKKYNASEDKEMFEKRLRKDKVRKISLVVINITVIIASLIYFL